MLEEPIGILSVTTIRRPTRGLHIGDLAGLRPEHTQEGLGGHGASAQFDIIGLLQDASALGPEGLQAQDKLLKSERLGNG